MGISLRSQGVKTFLGSLLIGGTALGAGMLGFPVATAGSGIVPAWIVYGLCWLFSVCTGLLFVEIGLRMPKDANIASMATTVFGVWGKRIAWALYIFLFYLLTIAYVGGGGGLISSFLGTAFPSWLGMILFTLFFGSFVYLGTKASGQINSFLMIGLVLTYFMFIILGSEKMNSPKAFEEHWQGAILGLPIIFTAFSYQGTIPSLLSYLDRDPQKMRIAIVGGTLIPLVAYLMWDFVIKGIIPTEGAHGLLEAKQLKLTAVDPLYYFLSETPLLYMIGKAFAFFALTTSFIGVTLGLRDFLADSLKVKKTPSNNLALCAVIYLPAVFITLINPSIFLLALSLAGGFGCALLLGAMPVLMAWKLRDQEVKEETLMLRGGKPVLALLLVFVAFEVFTQFYSWM